MRLSTTITPKHDVTYAKDKKVTKKMHSQK